MRVSLLVVARHRFIVRTRPHRLVALIVRLPVTGPRLRGIDELHELKYRVRARGNVDRAVDGTTDEQTGEATGAIFIKHESLCKRNGKHSSFSMQASAGQEGRAHWKVLRAEAAEEVDSKLVCSGSLNSWQAVDPIT